MKILMIAGKDERGGAPKSMLDMIRIIHENYDVDYTVVVNHEGIISDFCKSNGLNCCIAGHEPIVIAKGSTTVRRIAKWLLRPYYAVRCALRNHRALKVIENEVDLSSIDLIHTNSNRDGLGALINKKHGIKHVWHLREFGEMDYDTVFLYPYSVDFVNKYSSRFIAISKAIKEEWTKKGIASEKFDLVYNGVNTDKIRSNPNRKTLKESTLKIIFTGTICPTKGQIELIEALGNLPDLYKNKFKVDFFGSCTKDYKVYLESVIKKKKIEDIVEFCGYSNNIYSILQNYAIGVVCSKAEAFGRITPEYMAAGLITIASNTGANPELIDDNVDGFLYQYGDSTDLTRKLIQIYDMDEKVRIKISNNAEKKAREKFTAERNAEEVFNVYRKVLCEDK